MENEIVNYNYKKIKEPLLQWYQKNHRDLPWRKTNNPYNVWISEIMLQQTRVEAVKDYYHRFLLECPDVDSLSKLSDERLLKLWEGLGYYNRAKNLKKAAIEIVDKYNGKFPEKYEEILGLPGIGDYTAGAISSICFDEKTPAVDGNVLRVCTRLANWHAIIDEQSTKKQTKECLLPLYEDGDAGLLTQSLMELGAIICIPAGMPKCDICPLQHLCEVNRIGNYQQVPCRKEKKKRKIEERTVFILKVEDSYGIQKRPDTGLLSKLWEFPNLIGRMDTNEALAYISKLGYKPINIEQMRTYKHVFSHVEWHMEAYYIVCSCKQSDLIWVPLAGFEEEYALPTAFKVFLPKENREE